MCELQICKKVRARRAKRVNPRPPHGRQLAKFPVVFRFAHFLVQHAKSLAAAVNPRLKWPFAKLTLCSSRVYVQTRFVLESLGLQ
ncbi:MAG TPA: hypothetical protein VHW69_06500 [Rhizomicrobium sp.]|nr:hypothetical protein [Rhizomicrobium sp.]